MPANKMPEANVRFVALTHDIHFADGVEVTGETLDLYTADQMRAMYLAGIADARACVPEEEKSHKHDTDLDVFHRHGHNACRDQTLTNLTALEQEAKK